jgi:SAM-dependent MidA family methyltransferase
MEAALYDPEDGWYSRGAAIGPGGGFTTAAIALPFLATVLAAELRDLWERMGRPDPFTVVEVGPGDGTLASRLAAELNGLPLRLVLCDRGPGMLARARARVPSAEAVSSLDELDPITGAIVANEVHDAVPAHRLRWPCELLVGVGDDRRFTLVEGGAVPDDLARILAEAGLTPADGDELEVAPAQAELQIILAGRLARGALWVLDYGEAGPARYERRVPRLRTYLAGISGGDPLSAPGTQDITVDVDFGAVRAAGEAAGLTTVLDTGQAAWLRAHGALEAAETAEPGSAERLWLQALAGEGASGESFRVLVQERGGHAVAAAPPPDQGVGETSE